MAVKRFLGMYEIALDDKGRVRVPAKFKSIMDERFYIVGGDKPCLEVYPEEKFEALFDQVKGLASFDPVAKDFCRRIYTVSMEGEFDSAGRVLVPKMFRDYAKLDKQLIAAGVGDHFEIWDAALWEQEDIFSIEKRSSAQQEIVKMLQKD